MALNILRFDSKDVDAAVITAQHANQKVLGYIEKVGISANTGGSCFLFESGTNALIDTVVVTSGTNPNITYPRRKVVDQEGASSTDWFARDVVFNNLYWIGSGFTSGTNNDISRLEVTYFTPPHR